MPRRKKGFENELTPYETAFARNLVAGMSYAKAYNESGYKPSGCPRYSYLRGKKISERPRVQQYMQTLRESAWANNVMSILEKRSMLAELVRAKPNEIDETKSYVALSVDGEGRRTLQGPRVSDKLKAIELDMRAAGELNDDENKTNIAIQLVSERLSIPKNGEPLLLEEP
jgi:hypothetical protein